MKKLVPLLFCLLSFGFATDKDAETGLIIAPNYEEVKMNCTVCHSANLITASNQSRADWATMIKWMQDTQGLWPIDEPTLNKILDYLSSNYGPKKGGGRRAPIPDNLMPKNPYKS